MEEARRFDVRPLLVVAAVLAVLATLWATGAFAAGGGGQGDSSGSPAARLVQDGQEPAPSERDCPEDRSPAGGSGGSRATDL